MSQINANSIYDASGGQSARLYGVSMRNGGTGWVNRIINGNMVIDQRNAGASVTPTNGQFTVDRWNGYASQASKFSVQRNAGSVTPPAGFTNYLGVTSLSAYSVLAADYFSINQPIEGFNTADLAWGTASAATVTLSFWVRSSLTGTFGGSLQNGNQDYCYPFSYTVSSANTWEQKTVTILGPTSGTWLTANQGGIYLSFSLGVGSTNSGTAGSWTSGLRLSATGATSVVGTNGATFYITGVQLEAGSVATPFERRDYGRELIMCYRYFWRAWHRIGNSGNNQPYPGFVTGAATGTASFSANVTFPVTMRATPTLAFYRDGVSGAIWNVDTAGAVTGLSLAQGWFDVNGISGMIFSGTPLTSGVRYGCDFDISSEL